MFPKDLAEMMEKAKKIYDETVVLSVVGEAGAGMVKIHLQGNNQITKVEIDDEIYTHGKDVLEELLTGALNDSMKKIDKLRQEKMGSMVKDFKVGL